MNVPLRPINKTVIIRELKRREKTMSGLILPDHETEEVVEAGKIVAVAEDCEYVKTGDIVYYVKYNPQDLKIEIDGKEITLFVTPEKDIMAIEEK